MWFDSWADLGRVTAVGAAAYATLVLVLRVSGKRTLAKLNAFDLIVTVALGSTLATILLNSQVSWAEGATALLLLALLQLLVAWSGSRVPRLRGLVTAEPTLLVRDGTVLHHAVRDQRLTEAEVLQAIRSTGTGAVEDVAAVVLETDGTLSVIGSDKLGSGSALRDVSTAARSSHGPGIDGPQEQERP
jgi:uncharacterized membrane protein YcaP (DUF421 family)